MERSEGSPDADAVIIGAGPAGLTAARQLSKRGLRPVVLEKDDVVGGISRTVSHNGYLFDIGGHRFFTKVKVVEEFWHDVLRDGFLHRSRSSRILYNGTFFDYPLKPVNAVLGLGVWKSLLVGCSYVWAHLFPVSNEKTFEHWIVNRFGWRLYRMFFKTYTEKVWGTPCNQISAEWAAQRIKGLSLKTALINALVGERSRSKAGVVKTLIDAFEYPRRGPGMMWETVAQELQDGGSPVQMGSEVSTIRWSEGVVTEVEVQKGGVAYWLASPHLISSMPIRELVEKMDPPPPKEVLSAAEALKYRDFLTVAVVVDQADLFPDNWIYIHDDTVKVGRIQNFKNWSPDMVPDPSKTCLGLEYFCFEGDGLWTMADDDLLQLAKQELQQLGLAARDKIADGAVVRMPKAYPVYDNDYQEAVGVIREFIGGFANLQLVGRNGMHKYNNQDHSMLTAMLAVENILGARHDLWSVNAEQDYHEEVTAEESQATGGYGELAASQPLVPEVLPSSTLVDAALTKTFARLDKAAFATALGVVAGSLLLLATVVTLVVNDPDAVTSLALLSQYFIGYTVTYSGALIAFVYGFFWAFFFSWLFAYLRNLVLGLYVARIAHRARAVPLRRVLDFI